MAFRDYLTVLRRHIALIVVITLVGIVTGAVFTAVQKPMYESTVQVLISARGGSDVTDVATAAQLATTIVPTYAAVAGSSSVLDPVATAQRVPGGGAALASRVDVETGTNSNTLSVTVHDPSAKRASAVANAIAARLGSSRGAITPTTATANPVQLHVIQAATPAAKPSSPILLLDLAVGALVGLALAAGITIVREAADTRLRTVEALRRVADLPVLGQVQTNGTAASRAGGWVERGSALWGEAFRTLRTNLDFLEFPGDDRSLVITSAAAGEGKTTTAANLAIALAEAGESVVLVDADLRAPRVAGLLGIDGGTGLTDVIVGRVDLESAVQRWGERDLVVLPAGQMPPNPSELLRSTGMSEVLEQLRATYSYCIIDTAPLLAVSDAAILARRVAGVVLVARVGKVRRPQLATALAQLAQVGATVFGVVVNGVPGGGVDAYGAVPAAKSRRVKAERQRAALERRMAKAAKRFPQVAAKAKEAAGR